MSQCPDTGFPVTGYLDEATGLIEFEIDSSDDDPGEVELETQAWCDRARRKVANSEQAIAHLKRLGFQLEEIEIESIKA